MSVKRRLSQVLGATKKGYGVDTFEGGFPMTQTMLDVEAVSAAKVLALTALTAAAQEVSTGLTDPDAYRALSIVGNQASVTGSVVVYGKDWADRNIYETIVASGTNTVNGNIPFKTVYQVNLPVLVGAGDEISVGATDKLGLYRPLISGGALLSTERKAAADTEYSVDTNATLDTTYETVAPDSGITGADSFKFFYYTDLF